MNELEFYKEFSQSIRTMLDESLSGCREVLNQVHITLHHDINSRYLHETLTLSAKMHEDIVDSMRPVLDQIAGITRVNNTYFQGISETIKNMVAASIDAPKYAELGQQLSRQFVYEIRAALPEYVEFARDVVHQNPQICEKVETIAPHPTNAEKKGWSSYQIACFILAVLTPLWTIYQDISSSLKEEALQRQAIQQDQQQHEERMEQKQRHHEEALDQDQRQHEEFMAFIAPVLEDLGLQIEFENPDEPSQENPSFHDNSLSESSDIPMSLQQFATNPDIADCTEMTLPSD